MSGVKKYSAPFVISAGIIATTIVAVVSGAVTGFLLLCGVPLLFAAGGWVIGGGAFVLMTWWQLFKAWRKGVIVNEG